MCRVRPVVSALTQGINAIISRSRRTSNGIRDGILRNREEEISPQEEVAIFQGMVAESSFGVKESRDKVYGFLCQRRSNTRPF
jgi:hypothetical protein